MEYDVYSFSYNPATGNVWATLPDSTAQALHSHWNCQFTSLTVFGQKLHFRMWMLLSVLPQGPFQPGRGSHQRWWQGFRYFFCHFTIPYMFHNHVGVFSMLSNITPHPINPPNLDKMANFRIILTAWKMAYVLWLAISCNTAPFVKLAIFHLKWSISELKKFWFRLALASCWRSPTGSTRDLTSWRSLRAETRFLLFWS